MVATEADAEPSSLAGATGSLLPPLPLVPLDDTFFCFCGGAVDAAGAESEKSQEGPSRASIWHILRAKSSAVSRLRGVSLFSRLAAAPLEELAEVSGKSSLLVEVSRAGGNTEAGSTWVLDRFGLESWGNGVIQGLK